MSRLLRARLELIGARLGVNQKPLVIGLINYATGRMTLLEMPSGRALGEMPSENGAGPRRPDPAGGLPW